jgi:hypothetical protein
MLYALRKVPDSAILDTGLKHFEDPHRNAMWLKAETTKVREPGGIVNSNR